jgi:hypothetical protein
MPKAVALIAGSTLPSPALKLVCEAFDSVWSKFGGHFESPAEKEAARLILASAIVIVATNGCRDIVTLKKAGRRGLERAYWNGAEA